MCVCVCFIYVCVCVCVFIYYIFICGPVSSVGIATDYGLDSPGSNTGGDEIFRPSRPGHGAHPASCKMGTWSFPGVKCGRGVLLTTHPLLVPLQLRPHREQIILYFEMFFSKFCYSVHSVYLWDTSLGFFSKFCYSVYQTPFWFFFLKVLLFCVFSLSIRHRVGFFSKFCYSVHSVYQISFSFFFQSFVILYIRHLVGFFPQSFAILCILYIRQLFRFFFQSFVILYIRHLVGFFSQSFAILCILYIIHLVGF